MTDNNQPPALSNVNEAIKVFDIPLFSSDFTCKKPKLTPLPQETDDSDNGNVNRDNNNVQDSNNNESRTKLEESITVSSESLHTSASEMSENDINSSASDSDSGSRLTLFS